jgi:hypothetical protein
MTDLSKKCALIVDHGAFVELAFRLAREFGRVLYCDATWQEAYPKIDHAIVGDGFAEIERVREPWPAIDAEEVDVAIFPDVLRSGEQLHIEKLGIPVWGARTADRLEIDKWRFKQIQKDLGMNHAKYDVIQGLDELREYCRENKDRWIKVTPQFRGNRETFHHKDYETSLEKLAEMELEFGLAGKILTILGEHPLKGDLEGGLDTYTVDGEHPDTVVSGWEIKDRCYFAEVIPWSQVIPELREAVEPLMPILKTRRCRQMISTEVKIEERVLLEPTIRFPSPAGEEQMELYKNLGRIIWEGAHGNLIQPEVIKKFACEAMVSHNGNDERIRDLKIPDSVRQWVKLYNLFKVGDRYGTAPGSEIIGAVVGIGDSPQEALDHLKDNASALKDEDVTVHVEALAKALEEIEEAQAEGAGFKGEIIPEPAEALI